VTFDGLTLKFQFEREPRRISHSQIHCQAGTAPMGQTEQGAQHHGGFL
jgi:hypothetical protein